MGLTSGPPLIRGGLVTLDTAPLIYYLEETPGAFPMVRPLFDAIADHKLRAVVSVITLLEVLVRPLREGRHDLANRYRELLLATDGLTVIPVTADVSSEAARLRARSRLQTPDALILATARLSGSQALVTADDGLARVSGMRAILVKHLPTLLSSL